MNQFKKLLAWEKSMNLVVQIYLLTDNFYDREKYGLNSQMRRCAVSIPSNLAEGCGRNSDKQKLYFYQVAHGSSYELETQLILSKNLMYFDPETKLEIFELLQEIQKMIYSLINKTNSQIEQSINTNKLTNN